MVKANYSRLFLIGVLLAIVSAKCSSCRNNQLGELSDISFSITLSKDIYYIEDGKTPIILTIRSEEQVASELSYKCVYSSVQSGLGKLVNEAGEAIEPGSLLHYGDNELYYQPNSGSEGKHVLEITVSDEEGKVEKKRQIEILVKDHRPVDFQIQLQSDKPTIFAHQQAKLIIDISSQEKEASELSYQIKSISSNKENTAFSTPESSNITAVHALQYGINTLYYTPNKQIGEHTIKLVVANAKGDIRTATLALTIVDVDFQVQMKLEDTAVFTNHPAKLIIDITSAHEEVASELPYEIKSIASSKEGVSFSTAETNNIAAGHKLKYGMNILSYHPSDQIGKHTIKLVIKNSNGTSKTVTASFDVINTDFKVQLRPEKPTVFVHHQNKLIIDIASSQQEARKLTYTIKEISANKENISFTNLEGENIDAGYALQYGRNVLYYNSNKQIGKHDIKLVVVNSRGDIKPVTTAVHIVDVDFQVQLKSEKPTLLSHQLAKVSVNIHSSQEEAKELTYKVKEISTDKGGLFFTTTEQNEDVVLGHELKYGRNTLYYNAAKQTGTHTIKLVVENSNGSIQTVTAPVHIMDADYQVQLQPEKPTVFMHHRALLAINITSPQEGGRELNYTVKEISANQEGVSFTTLEGDDMAPGHILKYGKNTLHYNTANQVGLHDIKLIVENSNGSTKTVTASIEVVDIDFQVQLQPEKPTVFLHHQAKLTINISSSQEEARKLAYTIKEVNSDIAGSTFYAPDAGEEITPGYTLKYGKNVVYYNFAKQVGTHTIKLIIENSNGSRRAVTASMEVKDVDFQLQLKPEKPTIFVHHQGKLILEIASDQKEAKELTYNIKRIKAASREDVSFTTLEGEEIAAGHPLQYGKNEVYYNANSQIGVHDLKLTVRSSNNSQKTAIASVNIVDADFFTQVKINEVTRNSEKVLELSIHVGSSNGSKEDQWQIASWAIEGRKIGKLQDAIGQELKANNVAIQPAENRFELVLMNKAELTSEPQLKLVIRQPDGVEKPFVLDLSNYIFSDIKNNIAMLGEKMREVSKKFIIGERFAVEKFNRAVSQLKIIKNNLNILGNSASIDKDQLEDTIIKVEDLFNYIRAIEMDKAIYDKFGRGINEKDSYGRTPLIEAIDKGEEKELDLVLTHPNVDLSATHTIVSKNNNVAYPALSYAIIRKGNDVTIPAKLLKAGASLEDRVFIAREVLPMLMPPLSKKRKELEPIPGVTVLSESDEEYNEKVREHNREHNKEVDNNTIVKAEWSPHHMLPNQDYKGETALHIAVEEKNLEAVKLLVSQGADVNTKNGYWQTPLHIAINVSGPYYGNKILEIVKYLIDNGADVNATDLNDNIPLHYAVSVGNLQLVDLFLKNNALYFSLANRAYGKNKFGGQIDKLGQTASSLANILYELSFERKVKQMEISRDMEKLQDLQKDEKNRDKVCSAINLKFQNEDSSIKSKAMEETCRQM